MKVDKATDILSREEIRELTTKNDWRGAYEIFHTWLWIGLAFFIAGMWPNPFTIILALFIIGGKQLGCAIIMHDASHQAIFKSKWANNVIGNWFGGYPILHDVLRYRPYHIRHHVKTGTDDDPDLSLTKGYPTTLKSLLRKFFRDLSGVTGIKAHIGLIAMHLGYLKYELGGLIHKISQKGRGIGSVISDGVKNLHGAIITNVVLFLILWALGAWWLYLLWIGALLTTFNFSLRVRSIAEHSVVPDRLDTQKNTRTTYANFFERILFAPHYVNYHAEHHLLMTAPSYNLPKMHRLLKERGFFDDGVLEPNYWRIIKLAILPKKPDLQPKA